MSEWDSPIRRQPGVIGEQVEQEAVLLLPEVGSVIVLNEVGRVIWELIDGQRNPAALVAALVDQYEVTPDVAQADVQAFLADLRVCGAIR
ncbi:MAG: PqqD family protein [Oscillochloridaceae bacterium umkhey_bin13]